MTEVLTYSAFDHLMMAKALRLARKGEYTTKPNPMVGCVITQGEEIVGEGFHVRQGEAHAEVIALQAAGDRAKGSTVYVTLEPCAHYGRTPPCANALIAAGVSRVVVAIGDPFPAVNGKGVQLLQAAGITTQVGLMETQAKALNRGFFSRIERGRPWVTIKLGVSLDARTALADGSSKWITSPASREDAHRMRARAGAIVTGAGTVLKDDPSLTVRLTDDVPFVAPLRVVLDPGLATISRGRVREGDAPTLYIHAPEAKVPQGLTADHAVAPVANSRFDLLSVLHLLAAREINDVMVETGATLAGAFLSDYLVDEVVVYQSPTILGSTARPMFDSMDIQSLDDRCDLTMMDLRMVGTDVRLTFCPQDSVA